MRSEPEEGDWVTYDHSNFYEYGTNRRVLYVDPDATTKEMWGRIRLKMNADSFFPNVWFVSDHGNAHLMVPPRSRGSGRRHPKAGY